MLRRMYPNVYEGWLVVGSSAVIVLVVAATFFYGFGTIFNEVRDEFGWSNASTALAFSLRNEIGGVGAIFVGIALDRIGPKRVLYSGVTMAAIGVLGMSFMQELWHFYLVMVVIAFGSSAAGGQVGLTAISTWFQDRRAFAMSIMTLGGGIGGVFVVGIGFLVELAGWRWALRVLALLMLVVGLTVGSNVRSRPPGHPQPMDGVRRRDDGEDVQAAEQWGVPVRQAIKSRSFLLLSLAMLGSSFGFVALVVHQIPYLETQLGVSKTVASSTIAVFTLSSILGRIGFGYLGDRYPKRLVMAVALAMLSGGLLLLAAANTLVVAIAAIAIAAPGFGGTIPLRPSMAADYFGTKHFGTINGTMQFISTTGGAAGPWVVGRLVDVQGDYTMGWIIAAIVVAVVGIPSILGSTTPTALRDQYRGAATA